MPEFATGGALPKGHERLIQPSGCTYAAAVSAEDAGLLTRLNDETPAEYTDGVLTPTTPGSDWFFEGKRYREICRTATETDFMVTVRRAEES